MTFTITIAVGNGTLTVSGETADDFKANLSWASENVSQIIAAARSLEAPAGVRATTPVAAPAGPAPSCSHGTMPRLVQGGISKAGKPYGAFYGCTSQDHGSQCQSVYV
jgi:hypothetical protein